MIFEKSILSELRSVAGMTFACLLTIVITMALVRTLGNAASGQLEAQLVIPLIGFSTISSISTIITLTAFLSVFIVLSRQSRDSEMVIWLSSGQNLTSYIPVVWKFIFPLIILTLLTSIFGTPWARKQADELRQQSLAEKKLTDIPPGIFSEFSDGEKIIFIEQTDKESSDLGLVFISINTEDSETVVVGSAGRLFFDNQQFPWIKLKYGSRTDFQSSLPTAEIRSTKFENYKMLIDAPPKSTSYRERVKSTSTWDLIKRKTSADLGEISFRLGTILLCFLLPFLSIPFSTFETKHGRLIHTLAALLAFIAFNNLLGVIQALIVTKEISFLVGILILPFSILLITSILMLIKINAIKNPVDAIIRRWKVS